MRVHAGKAVVAFCVRVDFAEHRLYTIERIQSNLGGEDIEKKAGE